MGIKLLDNRKSWIDALRAFALILVIIGHQISNSAFFVFTSPVKIPLFFAVTGYVFNDKNGDSAAFFNSLFKKIVIPWLALTLIPAATASLYLGFAFFVEQAKSVLIGKDYWYMPCCIMAEILWFYSKKYFRNVYSLIVITIGMFFVAYAMTQKGILETFMISRACSVQLFICLGFCIRHYGKAAKNAHPTVIVLLSSIYMLLGLLSLKLYPGQCLDVHLGRYYSIPICLGMIVLGVIVLFCAAERKAVFPKWLVFIGQNTLLFYLWNAYVKKMFMLGLKLLKITLPDNLMGTIITTVFILCGCSVCAIIVNWYFPRLVGKTSTKAKG